jgi:hypothetical protein
MDARTGDFKNSAADLSRSGAAQNLKFERADWALFRTVEGLQQKAGREGAGRRRLRSVRRTQKGDSMTVPPHSVANIAKAS